MKVSPLTDRAAAFSGLGLWLWYTDPATADRHGNRHLVCANGDLDAIAATYHAAGARWLAVKTGDLGGTWPGQLRDLRRLRERGVNALGWVYLRHDDLAGEYALIAETIAAGQAVILDVEAEVEGKANRAAALLDRVRADFPDAPIAYSPLPVIDYHLRLPYAQYNRACDAVLPQFYVHGLGPTDWPIERLIAIWDEWLARWPEWGIPAPAIYPVIEGYAPADLLDGTIAALIERGYRGLSIWEYAQTPPAGWDRIAGIAFSAADPGPADPACPAASVPTAADR